MKTLRYLSLVALFVAWLSPLAKAENPSSFKVAYINLNKAFDEYNKTKEYDAALAQKSTAYENDRNDKIKKIQDQQNKLSLMKENEKAKLQDQLDKDKNALLEYDRQQQTDLRKKRDDEIKEILLEIDKIVKDYAEAQKFSVIFNDRFLAYGAPNLDVTSDIIKILNDKYPAKK